VQIFEKNKTALLLIGLNIINHRRMRCFYLLIFLCLGCVSAIAQNSKGALVVNLSYAAQLPGGDLADDFTTNLNIGLGVQYITKDKWIFGTEASAMFGGDLKQDVLANMRTEEGEIINDNQSFAIVFLEGRGFYGGVLGGKLINVVKKYPNSGIRLTGGVGVLQHKIRIQDRTGGLTQLQGEYLKGYDRLTNGLAFTEFIGYQHVSNNNLINFIAGFELTQGFTKNRRSWDYLEMKRLDEPRIDLLNGLRVGWVLTLGGKSGYDADEIFY
jgi:hypothetical protein